MHSMCSQAPRGITRLTSTHSQKSGAERNNAIYITCTAVGLGAHLFQSNQQSLSTRDIQGTLNFQFSLLSQISKV